MLLYDLKDALEIEYDTDGNIQNVAILGERPEIGIATLIQNEMFDIQAAVQGEVDENELHHNIGKMEDNFERMDAKHS